MHLVSKQVSKYAYIIVRTRWLNLPHLPMLHRPWLPNNEWCHNSRSAWGRDRQR